MTANRLVPDSSATPPVTGPDYMDDVAEEITALWKNSSVKLGSIAGTADAITAVATPPIAAYEDGTKFIFAPTTSTTDAAGNVTIAIDGLSAKSIVDKMGNPVVPGVIAAGASYELIYSSSLGKFMVLNSEQGLVGRQMIYFRADQLISRTNAGAPDGTTETPGFYVTHKTKDFDAATQEHVQTSILAPLRWDEGTWTAQFIWRHNSTTVNFGVVWGIQGTSFSDGDPGDVAFGTSVTVTDTGGTAETIYKSPETAAFTLAGTPAPGDWLVFQIFRKAADGADTLAVDARLLGVALFWTADKAREG